LTKDIEGKRPDIWLADNRGQVTAIVCTVTGIYDPTSAVIEDIVSRVILNLLRLKSLNRWNPRKGGFRVYFYTCVANLVGNVSRSRQYIQSKKTIPLDSIMIKSPWTNNLDALLDLDSWRVRFYKVSTDRQISLLRLLAAGYTRAEAARKMGISTQRVGVLVAEMREDYEMWKEKNYV